MQTQKVDIIIINKKMAPKRNKLYNKTSNDLDHLASELNKRTISNKIEDKAIKFKKHIKTE